MSSNQNDWHILAYDEWGGAIKTNRVTNVLACQELGRLVEYKAVRTKTGKSHVSAESWSPTLWKMLGLEGAERLEVGNFLFREKLDL